MTKRLYLLVFLTVLTACTAVTPMPQEPPASLSTLEPVSMPSIRYLALGDSYTIGEKVAEKDRWPVQLAALIEASPQFQRAAGLDEDIHVRIIARTGWTTDELWQGIRAANLEPPYDFVSLLIGVNNQYRGRDIEEYREQFVFLLNKSIEYAGGDPKRVIVLSIPDWGVTPFAADRDSQQIAAKIDQFNAVNREETGKAGARHIDITPISREALSDPLLIADDGLHPSGKMYALWVKKVLPVALEILLTEKGERRDKD
jgi:lysophospholipase L1-like esterase